MLGERGGRGCKCVDESGLPKLCKESTFVRCFPYLFERSVETLPLERYPNTHPVSWDWLRINNLFQPSFASIAISKFEKRFLLRSEQPISLVGYSLSTREKKFTLHLEAAHFLRFGSCSITPDMVSKSLSFLEF